MTASPTNAPSTGRLSGQVAVVTGGASGIGEAIVRRVADDGGKVVVGDRDERPDGSPSGSTSLAWRGPPHWKSWPSNSGMSLSTSASRACFSR
jgi:hypothetical protein